MLVNEIRTALIFQSSLDEKCLKLSFHDYIQALLKFFQVRYFHLQLSGF